MLTNIAPDIFRKRLLIEGYFTIDCSEQTLQEFLESLTGKLSLKTYGDPTIHATKGLGKEENQGYDAFVPLIDSGIYIGVWLNQKFLSMVLYTCKNFDDQNAVTITTSFFKMKEFQFAAF